MQKRYFIVEKYYFDFDKFNQLRIAGPGNHLFLGWTFPEDLKVVLKEYFYKDDQLNLKLIIPANQLEIHCPIVSDMRSIRNAVEGRQPAILFKDLIDSERDDLFVENVDFKDTAKQNILTLKNTYKDINDQELEYGVEIILGEDVIYDYANNYFKFTQKSIKDLEIGIRTFTNINSTSDISSLFADTKPLDNAIFSEFLLGLYDESAYFIEHLIKNNKTSSFEYGTIFPRDWMESADLGSDDFSKDIVNYIYEKVLENISEAGEGWHENVLGQYRSKLGKEQDAIDRKMIDIEPHYILGLKYTSPQFVLDSQIASKLKSVANYIVEQAENNDFISFKRNNDDYFTVGNWRDSTNAFPSQRPPVSPYDVNCVFYPCALRIIQEYNSLFEFDEERIVKLVDKWNRQKEKYKLFHPYNITGYSIALYGKKNKPMPISHLDESYELFYGEPSFTDVDSFAKKIINPSYFYTPVGPILVASDEDEFSTYNYHGKVIWPKQSAFAIGGLTRQYKIGVRQAWPQEILEQIKLSVITTCQACFRGWEMLDFVPELYYYDDKLDQAKLYTDQDHYEAQASNIQLWSSVAVRKIMSDYDYIVKN